MSYQFLGTAGCISCILTVCVAAILILDYYSELYVHDVVVKIAAICFIVIIAFWIVIGSICWLDYIWNWGLVDW